MRKLTLPAEDLRRPISRVDLSRAEASRLIASGAFVTDPKKARLLEFAELGERAKEKLVGSEWAVVSFCSGWHGISTFRILTFEKPTALLVVAQTQSLNSSEELSGGKDNPRVVSVKFADSLGVTPPTIKVEAQGVRGKCSVEFDSEIMSAALYLPSGETIVASAQVPRGAELPENPFEGFRSQAAYLLAAINGFRLQSS